MVETSLNLNVNSVVVYQLGSAGEQRTFVMIAILNRIKETILIGNQNLSCQNVLGEADVP